MSSNTLVWLLKVVVASTLVNLTACGPYVVARTDNPVMIVMHPGVGPDQPMVAGALKWNQPEVIDQEQLKKAQKKKRERTWVNGYWAQTQWGWEYIPGEWKRKK